MGKIEYVTKSWSPITGCQPGLQCWDRCWARRMANRQKGRNGYDAMSPFKLTFHPDRLKQPLHWKKPQRIAVSFMGDIALAEPEWLDKVFAVMALCPQHTFLLLTKRPQRMTDYFAHPYRNTIIDHAAYDTRRAGRRPWDRNFPITTLPLPNVVLGVSIENQEAADDRIPWLLKCPAAVRWLSVEPMIGPISDLDLSAIDWVVVGSESGPGARPMAPNWVRSIRDQCQEAGVPFYFKQRVEGGKKIALPILDGQQWSEMPQTSGLFQNQALTER